MIWTEAQQATLLNTIKHRNEQIILERQLAQTKTELVKRQQEQALSQRQWRHEQADVDRLSRLSWASLFYDFLNQKEQQISQEKAEAQQARLRYDAICSEVNTLEQQLENQQKRLMDYRETDKEYDQLMQAKRLALISNTNTNYEQCKEHLATLTHSNHFLQELTEAHNAGLAALQEVMQLRKLLSQARNWGRWDMVGGSAFSSMIKYEKLDDVREQSYQVTRSLQQFRAEYADLNQSFTADWQFDDNLTRFVDIFFDNIFTDWSVQSRINNALQTAQALENQLVTSITALKNQIEQSVERTKHEADALQRFLEIA